MRWTAVNESLLHNSHFVIVHEYRCSTEITFSNVFYVHYYFCKICIGRFIVKNIRELLNLNNER